MNSSFFSSGILAAMVVVSAASAASPADDAEKDRIGDMVVNDVRIRIGARDCSAAVDRLKAGLQKDLPKVALLAGTMYEHGVCVKRDWSTAVTFYAMAYEGGLTDAAERLAAGYADPANGPDIAAALWWGRYGRSFNLSYCTVSKEAADDPDRFVAELRTWPESLLSACNYIVGVISTISAELRYPKHTVGHQIDGEVSMRFFPGMARIEGKQDGSREYVLLGWVDGDTLGDRRKKEVTGVFEKAMSDVANRALARYSRPSGIPADTKIEGRYVFSIE